MTFVYNLIGIPVQTTSDSGSETRDAYAVMCSLALCMAQTGAILEKSLLNEAGMCS